MKPDLDRRSNGWIQKMGAKTCLRREQNVEFSPPHPAIEREVSEGMARLFDDEKLNPIQALEQPQHRCRSDPCDLGLREGALETAHQRDSETNVTQSGETHEANTLRIG